MSTKILTRYAKPADSAGPIKQPTKNKVEFGGCDFQFCEKNRLRRLGLNLAQSNHRRADRFCVISFYRIEGAAAKFIPVLVQGSSKYLAARRHRRREPKRIFPAASAS